MPRGSRRRSGRWQSISLPRSSTRSHAIPTGPSTRLSSPADARTVDIGVQAFDKLLQGCHSILSSFVESYLNVLERLLESRVEYYQVLGTGSFVKFSKIEEPSPSYNRHYDFFVEKLSAMCYKNPTNTLQIREYGIDGLRALFLKTADALWEKDHLRKIVPALLHCITDPEEYSTTAAPAPSPRHSAPPAQPEAAPPSKKLQQRASECLHELAARASVPHLRELLSPVFQYFSDHGVWQQPSAWSVYRGIIVLSQQETAISELVTYLDTHATLPPAARGGIVNVLAAAVDDASTTITPFINVFQVLLKVLRLSTEQPAGVARDETEFQELVLTRVPTLVAHTLDKQKVDVMIFVLGKLATTPTPQSKCNVLLCTLTLARTLKSLALSERLPSEVLDPVLDHVFDKGATESTTDGPDPAADVRVKAVSVLNELLAVKMERLVGEEGEKRLTQASRLDVDFLRQHSTRIHGHVYESLVKLSNGPANYRALMALLLQLAEFGPAELLDCVRLALALLADSCRENVAFALVFLRLIASRFSWPALASLCDGATAAQPEVHAASAAVWDGDVFAPGAAAAETAEVTVEAVAACLQPSMPRLDVQALLADEFSPSLARVKGSRELPRRGGHQLSAPPMQTHGDVMNFAEFQKLMQPAQETSNHPAHDAIWEAIGSAEKRSLRFAHLLARDDAEKGAEQPADRLSACAVWNLRLPALFVARITAV
eukprot:m.194962 g.194962  ORF g.194962 m.194962 type:complete len:718 (-) comp10076_c0_seq22:369-2522(-)